MLVRQIGNARPHCGGMGPVQRCHGLISRGVSRLPCLLQILQKTQDLIKLILSQRSKCVTYLIYYRFLNTHSTRPFCERVFKHKDIAAETGLYVY